MKSMKSKKIIIAFIVFSSILCITGAILKIHKVAFANVTLLTSIILEGVSIFLLIFFLIKSKRERNIR
jgi:hypothetical protein